jgi:hypothetical protein
MRAIEKLLKQDFWPSGFFTAVDWGDTSLEMPDIAVLKPAPREIKDKFGNDRRISNPWRWDYTTAIAVEIEMSPLKNKEQVLKNYHKDKTLYREIGFIVTSKNHEQELTQILNEDQPADPIKYWIEVIDFDKLNDVRPPIEIKKEEEPAQAETKEADQHLSKAEETILDYILAHGLTSREEILTEKGLLRREGKRYVPTDSSRNRERQDTL